MKTFREQGLDFLSNFYFHPFKWKGVVWGSSEAAYMACKDGEDRWEYWSKMTTSQAKQAGKEVILREDWHHLKKDFMLEVLKAKFSEPTLKKMLADTRNKELVEWNYWNDRYWGKCIKTGKGENNLGKLLMQVRGNTAYTFEDVMGCWPYPIENLVHILNDDFSLEEARLILTEYIKRK